MKKNILLILLYLIGFKIYSQTNFGLRVGIAAHSTKGSSLSKIDFAPIIGVSLTNGVDKKISLYTELNYHSKISTTSIQFISATGQSVGVNQTKLKIPRMQFNCFVKYNLKNISLLAGPSFGYAFTKNNFYTFSGQDVVNGVRLEKSEFNFSNLNQSKLDVGAYLGVNYYIIKKKAFIDIRYLLPFNNIPPDIKFSSDGIELANNKLSYKSIDFSINYLFGK